MIFGMEWNDGSEIARIFMLQDVRIPLSNLLVMLSRSMGKIWPFFFSHNKMMDLHCSNSTIQYVSVPLFCPCFAHGLGHALPTNIFGMEKRKSDIANASRRFRKYLSRCLFPWSCSRTPMLIHWWFLQWKKMSFDPTHLDASSKCWWNHANFDRRTIQMVRIPIFQSYSASKSDTIPGHKLLSSHGNYGICFGQFNLIKVLRKNFIISVISYSVSNWQK